MSVVHKMMLAFVAASALFVGTQGAQAKAPDDSGLMQEEADRKNSGSFMNNGMETSIQTTLDRNGKKVKILHLKDKAHGIDARVNIQDGNRLVATFRDGSSVSFNVAMMPGSSVDLRMVGTPLMQDKATDGGTNHTVGKHAVHLDKNGKVVPRKTPLDAQKGKAFEASLKKLCLQLVEDVNNAGGTVVVGFATSPYAQPKRENLKNIATAAKNMAYTRN